MFSSDLVPTMLQAIVDTDGRAHDIRVLRSIPPLDASARDALAEWRFRPGMRGGRPVPVIVTVQLAFTRR